MKKFFWFVIVLAGVFGGYQYYQVSAERGAHPLKGLVIYAQSDAKDKYTQMFVRRVNLELSRLGAVTGERREKKTALAISLSGLTWDHAEYRPTEVPYQPSSVGINLQYLGPLQEKVMIGFASSFWVNKDEAEHKEGNFREEDLVEHAARDIADEIAYNVRLRGLPADLR